MRVVPAGGSGASVTVARDVRVDVGQEVDWVLRASSESGFTAACHLAVADEQATSTARQGAAAMQGRRGRA